MKPSSSVNETSVRLTDPPFVEIAPPRPPPSFVNATPVRSIEPPLLNSAPPPFSCNVWQPFGQFSSAASSPPVRVRFSIVTGAPSTLRILAGATVLSAVFCEPSIVVSDVVSPSIVSDFAMSMSAPSVRL